MKSFSGETVLRGDDFKRYVNSLRGKSNTYKKRRAEISDLKAEIGVLSRTVEVLHSRQSALEQTVSVQGGWSIKQCQVVRYILLISN